MSETSFMAVIRIDWRFTLMGSLSHCVIETSLRGLLLYSKAWYKLKLDTRLINTPTINNRVRADRREVR